MQVLWLNDNEITNRGAARLAEAVRDCMDEVQELYLYRNPIGAQGKRLLRGAFRNKTAKVGPQRLLVCFAALEILASFELG